ncbi:hypothetical protein ASD02_35380 [Ensifer sp. Root1252]|nr:hypothetical protein ASD02_35380 [Ensifer sp. Root1252]KRC67103.1 hypothetical protein ASE32_35610 [Ensifer sp. Root231]KRC93682.1 hypothetical protein ASE47_35465 [Ensifer sp. Root258]
MNFGCANHRIDDAVEDDKRAVSHQFDNAAMVPSDSGIGQFGADRSQPSDLPASLASIALE